MFNIQSTSINSERNQISFGCKFGAQIIFNCSIIIRTLLRLWLYVFGLLLANCFEYFFVQSNFMDWHQKIKSSTRKCQSTFLMGMKLTVFRQDFFLRNFLLFFVSHWQQVFKLNLTFSSTYKLKTYNFQSKCSCKSKILSL